MSTEEENYDELYLQGFNDGIEDSEDNEDELEQPTEEEEVQPTEEIDESTEEATDEPDEDSSEDSQDTEEEEVEDNDDEVFVTIERFGEQIPLTKEEAIKMSQLGWDYTSKTQDLSTQRKKLELVDGIPDEVLQALQDTAKGNKEALATIANQYNIDPYDIDGVGEYKPTIIEKNYELEDIVNEIKSDTDNGSHIDTWIKELPKSTNDLFVSNPAILRGLHVDAKKGVAKKIMPEVIKTMKLNPTADFVQTYQAIGSRLVSTQEPKKEAKPQASREQKKKAVPSKAKSSKHLNDHKTVWDDNDLFEKMRAKAGLTF